MLKRSGQLYGNQAKRSLTTRAITWFPHDPNWKKGSRRVRSGKLRQSHETVDRGEHMKTRHLDN